MNTIKDNGVVT